MDCKKHRNFAHLERLDRILFADRHLANNLLNVRLVCSLLNLEYPVRESIAYCLRKKLRTISNIKNRLTLQVACVYSICKKFNLPITLDTIIQLYYDIGFYVNSRLISRQLRSFNLRTNTKTTPFTQRMAFVSSQISDLLAHIRNQSTTELKSKLIIQAEMILNQMQKRFIAGAPKIIAGGVVAYIFAENQIMKKYQVAHALKISQSYIYSLDHRIRLSIKA
jgi:transcription initiation factor TFIIIB Brf1 subunit/transcription initiation factor TFIIB